MSKFFIQSFFQKIWIGVLIFCLDFLINGIESRVGLDLNGDGYIGGEGI